MSPRFLVIGCLVWCGAAMGQEAGPPGKPDDGQDGGGAGKIYSIAAEPRIRLRGSAWFTNLDGHAKVGEQVGTAPADLDFKDTLNLGTHRVAGIGSVGFDLGAEQRLHVDLSYAGHFDYSGRSDPVTVSFNDLVYAGVIDSETQLDIFGTTVLYDIARQGPLTLSIGAGARVFWFRGSVTGTATDPATGITAVQTSTGRAVAPIPGLAAALRWDITDQLFVRAGGQGLWVGKYGNYFDAAGEIGFDFTPNVGVYGGYRWLHGAADIGDVDFRVDLMGPYAGLEVRF